MEDGGFIPMSAQQFLPVQSKWKNWGTRKGPDPELSQGWALRHEAMWHLQRAVQIGQWQ